MKKRKSTRANVKSMGERQASIKKRNGKASFGELMAIARRASRPVKRPYVDHDALLYDDRGLPK